MDTAEKLNFSEKRDIVIDSGLQLIPGIGGALSTVYFGTKQAKAYKRIERFYSELCSEISEIKSQITSISNHDEDGLVSLIEQVNDKVEKEHQELKFQCYKKYMKNILINPVDAFNYDKRKVFLDIIEDMSLLECEILALLYKNKGNRAQVRFISKPGVNQYAIVGSISKLKSYGFLRTTQGSFSIGGNEDNLLEEFVGINEYGIEFVEFTLA